MSAENAVPATKRAVTMEKLVNLCKRRGIVFPTSDIYGGLGSTFDYGPLGAELKRNVKEAWWREMVQYRSDVLGLDWAILQHPRTWEASGHLQEFHRPAGRLQRNASSVFAPTISRATNAPIAVAS